MASPKVQVNVKKVRPYPFVANLEQNSVKKPVEIIYVGVSGVIASLKSQIVSVGEYFQISFELPGGHDHVVTQVRVLKTYDKSVNPKELRVERMAEFHFQSLTKEHRSRIVAFLAAIGQAK